jgi:hypothetical protein
MAEAVEYRVPEGFPYDKYSGIATSNNSVFDYLGYPTAHISRPTEGAADQLVLKWSNLEGIWIHIPDDAGESWKSSNADILTTWLSDIFPLFRGFVRLKPATTADRSQVITIPWEAPPEVLDAGFYLQLLSELDLEPVEDGMPHAIEKMLEYVLAKFPSNAVDAILVSFRRMLDEERDSAAAGLLQCIGRIKSKALEEKLTDLVSHGLSHPNPELREAAISVVEQVGNARLKRILREHSDPLPWLNRYATQVLADLSA